MSCLSIRSPDLSVTFFNPSSQSILPDAGLSGRKKSSGEKSTQTPSVPLNRRNGGRDPLCLSHSFCLAVSVRRSFGERVIPEDGEGRI